MKRKVMAILMAAALCVGLLPSTTLAEVGEYSADDAEDSAEETDVQAANIELAEDGTATVVLGDVEGEEEQEEEAAETEEPLEVEPDGEAEEAAEAEEEAGPEEVVYTGQDGSVSVKVTAPYGALPEDAELKVERFDKDSKEYKDAAEAIGLDEDDSNMAALDISFVADGEEVEPGEAVKVSIDASEILPEDADASTLEVQHLEEKMFGVKPVVVANDSSSTEGTINEAKATAEFEVASFSVFTITWDDGTGTTIEVHVYSMNGTSIDEELNVESYTSTSSVITISDLVSHLEQNASYTNTYTYRYATVVYETQQGGGYSSTTIGGQDNSVSSISKSGTTYTVTTSSGTTTVTDPDAIVIHLYYSIPEVTLATEDPYAETVEFTTSSNYFVGDTSDATYTWALSDDTLGTLTHPTSGQATFTWSDSAQSGDQVTVTVTMTVGEETASDTYTLTYGDDPITFTVYAQDGTTPQENARVALVDASGNTVATGTTGVDGTVTLYAPAGEYTVGVTYVYLVSEAGGGSTSRATAETTITVSDDETVTGSVTLGTAVTSGPGGDTNGSNGGGTEPYYYEHIDVKVAVAETSDSDVTFSDLDAVYVYDKYGNLLYVSEDINANPGTTDYNVLFDINGNEDQHSIVVSSEDTIVLVYEVKDNETGETSTYTVSYRSGDTYPADEYYPYNAINAYQLYNILYNANYTSQEAFEAAWGPGLTGYNEAGISISGYSYTLIADYLCDTRTTTGQAGLDFVIYVQELEATQDDFDFRVAKTVENVPDTLGSEDIENFTFTLQELDKVQDDGDYTEAIWSTEEGNILSTSTDSISSFTQNSDGAWSGILDFLGALQYEAEDGTNFYYYILSEDTPTTATPTQQYYGLKVTVTYTAATGVATIVVSYCTLGTQDDNSYYRTSGWTGLTAYTDTDDEGDEYTYYSIPFVNTYSTTGFELEKVDVSSNPLSGAVFTMSTLDGTTLNFTSETVDGTVVYTLASSTTEGASADITVTGGGPVSIQGIAAGTYTLSETTAPNGYIAVDDFTVTIADDGTVTVNGTNVSVADDSDVVTVTDLEATSITVNKTWADNNNAYTTRPDSITVTITGSDGNTYTLTLNNDNNWEATQDNLPKTDSSGADITYTVTEEAVDGYSGTVVDNQDGTFTITNTLTGTTEITVNKTWVDSDNKYETRPSSITVTITGSDGSSNTLTLNDNNSWSDTQSGLPLYDSSGTQITYAVTEETVNGYTGSVVDNGDGTFTITNTLDTTEVSGSKTWASDSDDKYNTRPDSITINILNGEETVASVTVTENDNWQWSVTGLPKYDSNGGEITYTISEDAVPGYTTSVSGYDVTNTLITTEVSGEKTWVDEDNANDTRPDSITIYLYADGEQTGDTAVVTSSENWKWTFSNLPKYQSDGTTEIVYTIMEGETEEGHLGEYIPSYSDNGLSVTNAIPEVSKYVSDPAYGEDVDDELGEDEADNNDTLEYEIKAEHVGNAHNLVFHDLLDNHLDIDTLEIESVILYESEDSDGQTLNEGDDYTFTKETCGGADCGLDGCSFEIEIFDDDLAGLSSDAYVVVIFDITLKEDVEDFDDEYVAETDNWANISFFSLYATPVEVETYSYGFDLYKYDGDTDEPLEGVEFVMSNSDGKYAQFEVDEDSNTYLLTGWADSKDDATAIVTGSDGKAVVEGLHDGTFSIEETTAPDGYQKKSGTMTVTITVDENDPDNPTITATNADVSGLEVQISNTPGEGIEIIGSKTWDDADDADGVRPDSITIHLLADGEEVDSATVTADDNWAWSFADLDQYDADGNEITYTITEDAVDDYDTTISGYNVTNTHEYETRDISGSKTWEDDNDKADARPSSITVNLFQNGELYDSKTVTEADDWTWSWTGLPKNASGEAIAYTITEDAVDYYDTTYYSGSFDITNTFVGEEGAEPGSGQGGDNPKTGDTNTLGTWLALLIAAMACLLVGFRMRKSS